MRHHRSGLVPTRAMLPALVVTILAGGCSADSPPTRWRAVTSGRFTGAGTERLDLGTFHLAGGLRVAWTLNDPGDARSIFELTATRASEDGGSITTGASIPSWSQDFSTRDDSALFAGLEPHEWRLTLAQRVQPGAVGYSGVFTVYAQEFD